MIDRTEALALLKQYNKDPFHLRHALTVEKVMRFLARDQGFEDELEYWGLVGLLHDLDFEMYPEEHCQRAPAILMEAGASEQLINSIRSHAWGMHPELPEPEHYMEKLLFATDELTGLIYAAALMRPSRSVQDMELKSLRKKFKDKAFAAGCSRDVIARGAELLGWTLDELFEKTLEAMREAEPLVEAELPALLLDDA